MSKEVELLEWLYKETQESFVRLNCRGLCSLLSIQKVYPNGVLNTNDYSKIVYNRRFLLNILRINKPKIMYNKYYYFEEFELLPRLSYLVNLINKYKNMELYSEEFFNELRGLLQIKAEDFANENSKSVTNEILEVELLNNVYQFEVDLSIREDKVTGDLLSTVTVINVPQFEDNDIQACFHGEFYMEQIN